MNYRRDYALKDHSYFRKDNKPNRDYGLRNTLNSEGTERSRKKEKDLSTQVEGGRREEKHKKHQL